MTFGSLNLYALAPVESLDLGNFSDKYVESVSDPLFYLFKRPADIVSSDMSVMRKSLAIYRGFYEEGKNLEKFCRIPAKIEYATSIEKMQAERSVLATLQYIALDLTSRAIPQYAKYFEFSKAEYSNLVEGMIGNHCSANLSVISIKELKNNLLLKFEKENSFQLPSVSSNKLFPSTLKSIIPEKIARENEFKYSVKIFEYACSWGGDPQNAGLLIPFLKDHNLMSFIFRQMSGKSFDWNEYLNLVTLQDDSNTLAVWCDGLICRKMDKEKFNQRAIHALGSFNFYDDFRRLYCEEIIMKNYRPKENDPRLAKIMNSISLEEEVFLSSQLTALITGVPDFLLGTDSFNKGEDVFRANIDQFMTDWAQKSVENFSKELFFEESLTLELIERKQYFDPFSAELKLAFDVNLGEFDRINQSVGKVKVTFEINILKSYLRYYRQAIIDLDSNSKEGKNRLNAQFKLQITNDVQNAKNKLLIPPWKGDLEAIIVSEISDQLLLKEKNALKLKDSGFEKIIVEISYAPFALKYINHQFNMLKNANGQKNDKK
jgi:hypothetical protein